MRFFNRPTALTLLIPVLILAGCSHTIPATDRAPQPLPQIGKTPPTIAPLNAAGKHAQAPEAMLPVTLTTDLTRQCLSGSPMRITRSPTTIAGGLSEKANRKYRSRMDW